MTSVPLVSLDGRGNTSIGFSIYHRSNQTAGTLLGVVDGGAGRGFTISAIQTVTESTDTSWNQGANSVASFTKSIVKGQIVYTRAPGTRADMTPYLVGGQIRGWDIVTQGDKTRYVFRQEVIQGLMYRLTQIIDSNGNTINYTYDASDRPTQITDASSQRSITIGYTPDANAQVSWVQLNFPGGTRRWDFGYSNWYLGYIDYPAPVTGGPRPRVSFHYDSNSNIDDVYDLKGHRWHYSYSTWISTYLGCRNFYPPSLINPTTAYDTLGTSLAFSVYTGGPVTDWTKTCTITDRRGWNWKHVYYNSGGNSWFQNPIKETWDGGFLSYDRYTWDYSLALPLTHIDRRGWTTSFQYDTRGNMTQKTDREGWIWRWIYSQDKVVTQIDPTANRTIYAYFPVNFNLSTVTVDPITDPFDVTYNKPAGIALTTNYTYNATGELATTWTGSDAPTTYSNFDAYGNARTVTPPNAAATTMTFDELNNKISVTEPSPGGTTSFTYDNWNRPLRTTFPGGSYSEKTYDNVGNVLTVRDPMGIVSTMTYDGLHRLMTTTQRVDANSANDIVVTYDYDVDSNRIKATNGRGKITWYDFNSRNQLWRIRYPDNTSRQFGFDGNNNRIWRIDGQNRTTNYSYDKENRLTLTDYPLAADDTTNYWRSDGLRDRFTDPTGTTQYTYNGAKQLVSVFQPVPNKTVTYTYDTGGRRKTMVVGSQTWTYNYDASLRLDSLGQTVGAPIAVDLDYNPNGSVSLQTFGSGSKVVFDYDTRGRTNWISHQNASSVEQQRFSYTYDDNGNVLTYRDNIIGGNNWLTTYTYDYANRLKTDVRTGGASFNYNNAYSYDKNGNRTSVTRNGTPSTYTVDDNDKLLSGDGFTLSSYSADGAPGLVFVPGTGNLTFSYDYENRMSQVVLPTHTDTFRYNGDGLRVERISNQGTQRYVYDGNRIIAVCDGAGTILTWFSPLGESLVTGTTQYYYRQNAIGSNIGVTLSNGTLSSIKEFDAYGIEYTVQSGAWTQFRFVGKHGVDTDTDTGLVHMGHRYYAPKLGRFLTQDPIGHEAGLNLYQYCENNPVVTVDPDGMQGLNAMQWANQQLGAPRKESAIIGLKQAANRLKPDPMLTKAATDVSHIILEVLGFIDPTPVADSIHAGLFAAKGDLTSAGIYLGGAAIPFASGGVVNILKHGIQEIRYTPRVFERMANGGRGHNFPNLFDAEILAHGSVTIKADGYHLFKIPGSIGSKKSQQGFFEIGGYYSKGRKGTFIVNHRTFVKK